MIINVAKSAGIGSYWSNMLGDARKALGKLVSSKPDVSDVTNSLDSLTSHGLNKIDIKQEQGQPGSSIFP